ncbi:olfactory receptor 6N1-like [Sphaerodactylus townsendi]|uniref:olfactory receptor 6N1-like n=1 Tax=Sphaerodactylus townsendi TaxID=933632 RepID=UPI0020272BD1|nr:olfactory receptor 6N1-like [Sphaerodactylus townsendi]
MDLSNHTRMNEFIIRGFPSLQNIRVIVFVLVFIMYTLSLIGNLVILFIIKYEPALHTPMYFFLGNFSFLEICFTSVTVPTMLMDLLKEKNTVSFNNCLAQIYFFHGLGGVECLLLAAMAFDRYVAIRSPLRYNTIMNSTVYIQLATWSWMIGLVLPLIPVILISQLNYCSSNVVDHFFCDILPLLRLVCNRTQLNEMLSFFICSFILVGSFTITTVSYVAIIITVLRIPSSVGRKKAFSTFTSHLTVVGIFYGTMMFIYVRPTRNLSFNMDQLVAVFYCLVTPVLNPIIYSLRNKEVRTALKKFLLTKMLNRTSMEG